MKTAQKEEMLPQPRRQTPQVIQKAPKDLKFYPSIHLKKAFSKGSENGICSEKEKLRLGSLRKDGNRSKPGLEKTAKHAKLLAVLTTLGTG